MRMKYIRLNNQNCVRVTQSIRLSLKHVCLMASSNWIPLIFMRFGEYQQVQTCIIHSCSQSLQRNRNMSLKDRGKTLKYF